MQPGRFFRLVAPMLALVSLFMIFNAPTGLNQRLTVTPDSFHLRIGSWYSPVETRVEFTSMAHFVVQRSGDGDYEFRAVAKGGDQISVPMYDLLRKALPESFHRAEQHRVVIGEGAAGLQIPAALRE